MKMKVTLLTVGKTDMAWVKEGLEMYRNRLVHYIPFSIHEIPELKGTSSLSVSMIKDKEAERILDFLKPSDDVILLDEHGKQYRSVEFAAFLEKKMTAGSKDIVFVIGGAYGFSEKVYKRATSMLSLSGMTFSHQMVRTVFAEQLYRAFTIIRGEPYHNE